MKARGLRFLFPISIAFFLILAMIILHICTPAGAGLANDSVAYIAGARSLLQGTGYSDIWLDSSLEAITHYPPLLSLTLYGMGLLGMDPLRGARVLNILLFGANTALMAVLGWRISKSKTAGIWASLLFLLNASLLRVHVFALSEPLFLFFSLLSFVLFDLYFSFSKHWVFLLFAGIATGLACLTRYSALALLPTFIITTFIFNKKWHQKLSTTAIFMAGSLPFLAAWLIRNKISAGNATNRSFHFHPITSENIQPGIYNFSRWLLPIEPIRKTMMKLQLVEWILAILGAVLIYWLISRTWQSLSDKQEKNTGTLAFSTALYIFAYIGAVLFSMSFFDASTKFQVRILAPIYVSLMLLMTSLAAWLWQINKEKTKLLFRTLVIILAVTSTVLCAYDDSKAIAEFRSAGQGYASWKWHDSRIMATLRELPKETAIYTNSPPAIYLVIERASKTLPTPIDPVDNQTRNDYEENLSQMQSDLLSGRAVLALFDTSDLEDALGTQNIQSLTSGLKIIQKTQGDILYGNP